MFYPAFLELLEAQQKLLSGTNAPVDLQLTLYFHRYSKPEEYGIVEVPLPKLRPNDILIKVKACGGEFRDLHRCIYQSRY